MLRTFSCAAAVLCLLLSQPALAVVATFDDLLLPAESYWNGADDSGGFTTGGVTLPNSYNSDWFSWEGWAYSNKTDSSTPGWANQYSAITGGGVDGSAAYGVAYLSGWAGSLAEVPVAVADTGIGGRYGFYLTNTAYAYHTMDKGDPNGFARKFAGPTEARPGDYFKVVLGGLDGGGLPIAGLVPVEFYLADFRSTNADAHYIVNDWRFVDVGTLVTGGAAKLSFSFDSSDSGEFGINTPTYLAIDQAPLARTWNGGAGGNWQNPNNWTGNTLPDANGQRDKLIFTGTSTDVQTSTNDFTALSVGGVQFAAGAGRHKLTGETLNVSGTIDDRAAAHQQIDLPITFEAGGVLHVAEPFDATAATGVLTLSQPVGGAAGLTKTGAGKAELTAASNGYTGDTKVKEGVLQIDAGIDSNGQWATRTDSTTVGTAATTAELITTHVRQDTLTINAGSKVAIQSAGGGASTSVVNFLKIANTDGSFDWGGSEPLAAAPDAGNGVAPVPEPATWLLLALAAGLGLACSAKRRMQVFH